ncbi:MAG: hypothetical protein IT318_06005 [Anaerolineales bacterium]|nr:hypothetical protein [Anaerolineales bacterium]
MPSFLPDPRAIVVLCLIIGFVLGVNAALFGLLRGGRRASAEASKWTAAIGGGAAGQRAQAAQLAELHRAVEALAAPPARADGEQPGTGA